MNEANQLPDDEHLSGTEEDLTNEVDATVASTEESQETAQEESQDTSDDSAAQEQEQPAKKSGIQRRFQKYDEKLAAAAQELEYWKNIALEKSKATETVKVAEKPKLADYESVEDYVEAREAFLKQELLSELERTAKAKTEQATVEQSYIQRVTAAKAALADWDEVMEDAADEPTMVETVEFCMDSAVGPKIAYHLAKNPDLHARINAMSPIRRIAELGKLEEKLTTKKPVEAKPITKAPNKLTEVSGGGTPVKLSTDNPKSYAEWKKAHEQRQKSAKR